jgi:uncharacterized Ntn-hydrolase superfamily protein
MALPRRSRFIIALCLLAAVPAAGAASPGTPTAATFSVVACDTAAGEWGVAVASRFLAVGSVVPWARAGAGAVATQAYANTSFGPDGLEQFEKGGSARAVLQNLLAADDDPQTRQVGLVDPAGGAATHTGRRCQSWAGGRAGPGFVVQGNLLTGEHVVVEMAEAFEQASGHPLAERLLAALAAGDREGGDIRGKQAAALLVVRAGGGYGGSNDRYVDLRVDDHADPVAELYRLYTLHAKDFLPIVHARLGDEALARGDRDHAEVEYSRAINLYRDAIAAFPEEAGPRNGLAWFYAEHRVNLDEAMALAREAYGMDPGSWQVLDTIATIHFIRGQFDKALEAAGKSLDANPGNVYLQQQVERFRKAREAADGLD